MINLVKITGSTTNEAGNYCFSAKGIFTLLAFLLGLFILAVIVANHYARKYQKLKNDFRR